MTNINDDNDIDLELSLGCTTRSVETKRNDDNSGAGVNASSMMDMAFAASNPLSELVWSPHKGLSLKCADSSLTDKKPFLLWNVGLSNLIDSSPSQSGRFKGIFDENAVNEIIVSHERFQKNVMGSKSGNEIGCSREAKIMNAADGVDMLDANQDEGNVKNSEKGFSIAQDIQITGTAESCENHAVQGDYGTERLLLHGGSSNLDIETTEPQTNQELATDDECKNGDFPRSSQALIPTVKESEVPACMLQNLPIKIETGETSEFAVGEDSGNRKKTFYAKDLECIAENDIHVPGIKETCDQNKEQLLKDSSVPLETCPTHSRSSSYRRKGKGKALSDGNVNSKMSNDEESSHESVESCNSTGLFRKVKKRWHFEQHQFFVGSKRIRKHMHGDPVTDSAVARGSSSFMTWISNMVRGFSNSNLVESPTLALAFNNEENRGKETNHREIVMYDKDHDPSNRSTGFQSVFQSMYCPTMKVAETEVPKELPSADKILIEVPPISCLPADDFLTSSDKINQSSAENKASSDIACSKAKDGLSSSIERDVAYDASNKNKSVRSLWITRFSNKTPGAVLNIDNSKPTAHETLTCARETSVECRIAQENSQRRNYSAGDRDSDIAANDSSTGSKEIHDSNNERSVNILQPILPSANFKKSEALASLFARRLDALKNIVPSKSSHTRTTCFFCGRSGHDLRNCSEVTESELENLITNIRSYDGAEESSCLCVRCFQLDHWAISCPTSSSNLHLFTGNESLPSLLEIKQGRQVDPTDLTRNRKQFWLPITSGSNLEQNSLKENIISSNLVSMETAGVPKGIFDIIRSLRLSRVDILKWMNSNTSLSHLDGFFLRLRLGKLEAGLEGTGYHVACISGLKGKNFERDSKNRISVNVCGVKCFVGSQYVSNQDFLEDELTVWWRKTSESGGKVPREEDLRVKLEERMKLGF